MAPLAMGSAVDSSSLSEQEGAGISSAELSGDEAGFRVPGKDIYYKRFVVPAEDMEKASRAILAVFPSIAPTFLKLSLEVCKTALHPDSILMLGFSLPFPFSDPLFFGRASSTGATKLCWCSRVLSRLGL